MTTVYNVRKCEGFLNTVTVIMRLKITNDGNNKGQMYTMTTLLQVQYVP